MNFFQYQDQARRQTRWLIMLFILAVVVIVVVIDVVVLLAMGLSADQLAEQQGIFSTALITSNWQLLAGTSAATLAVVGLASLFRMAGLRSGGGKVARDLGGTLVTSDTRDANKRRLRNVVEEMALASGIPTPEIYVLEQESGINAFAAGFTPSDAAITVTRGALEHLTRDELQGVIAHEFSHIFNGDMRLNIRLMGVLFGILVLALVGRRVLLSARYTRSSRNSGAGAILLIALAVTAVGYIGLFFGRLIKSAVSRQREYLADASAVQFTRNPEGIAGALKKIAVHSNASYLDTEAEEVSHMLFGAGRHHNLLATHPPLLDRIRRIQPDFQEYELKTIHDRAQRASDREKARVKRAAAQQQQKTFFDTDRLINSIGNPDWEQLVVAAGLAASIPDDVKSAAHSSEWAPEVMLLPLLDKKQDIREQQLLIVSQQMGEKSEIQLRALVGSMPDLAAEQRLPLLELCFPALKRRPANYLDDLMTTVKMMVHADGKVDVFEYVLAKLIQMHLDDAANPAAVVTAGKLTVAACAAETSTLLTIIATHGHRSADAAEAALNAGLDHLDLPRTGLPPAPENWYSAMDKLLARLDLLRAVEKEKLVTALLVTVAHDQQLVAEEIELMRAVCAAIHTPLPAMAIKN